VAVACRFAAVVRNGHCAPSAGRVLVSLVCLWCLLWSCLAERRMRYLEIAHAFGRAVYCGRQPRTFTEGGAHIAANLRSLTTRRRALCREESLRTQTRYPR